MTDRSVTPDTRRRVNLLDDPARLLRERNAARSALAEVVRATYNDDIPDWIANHLRYIAVRGAHAR